MGPGGVFSMVMGLARSSGFGDEDVANKGIFPTWSTRQRGSSLIGAEFHHKSRAQCTTSYGDRGCTALQQAHYGWRQSSRYCEASYQQPRFPLNVNDLGVDHIATSSTDLSCYLLYLAPSRTENTPSHAIRPRLIAWLHVPPFRCSWLATGPQKLVRHQRTRHYRFQFFARIRGERNGGTWRRHSLAFFESRPITPLIYWRRGQAMGR
jgi:hypothetical protein